MVIKKRGAVFGVVILLLCIAVYLNWSYSRTGGDLSVASDVNAGKTLGEATLVDAENTGEQPAAEAATTESEYFAQAQLSRQKARDEALNIIKKSLTDKNTTDEAKKTANDAIATLANNAVNESRIENLIKAKGYKDCVVFINEQSVNVIIQKVQNGLKSSDVAKIRDIVMDEAKVNAGQIKIVEAE